MTLLQLRYLIAIADSGLNITLAAERVHATQPGLSKQLKLLEEELGFQLFTRKGKSLDSITRAGGQVLERARTILAEALNIRSIAANMRNEQRGELRIVTTHTQARFALPATIAALSRLYPQVSVHLQPADDADVLTQLEKGRIDLAIVSTAGATPAIGVALPAYRWNRVVLVPRTHPLAKLKRAPTLQELTALPLISYDSSQKPESSLRRAFEAQGLHPQIVMTAGDADLIKTYVRAGMGVGVLAEMALQPNDAENLHAENLHVLAADHLLPTCTTWVVLRREGVLRDFTAEFIARFIPHLDRRAINRALSTGTHDHAWPEPPLWSAWQTRSQETLDSLPAADTEPGADR